MHKMRFRGNRAADFDRSRGTGLVGKVVGPGHNGRWYLITAAAYDEDADATFVVAEEILRPEHALARQIGGVE